MRWESTDQFGNLFVGSSEATSREELKADLESMAEEVFLRREDGVAFAIDLDYAEIAAPDANQVSHVMQLPWISHRLESGEDREAVFADIEATLAEALAGRRAHVQGPWEA